MVFINDVQSFSQFVHVSGWTNEPETIYIITKNEEHEGQAQGGRV